ncbi:WCX domain-containing protein [Aquimarina megaterium]|uniref:WYL domain-containing protein n=1 Tax=Aquimarina megaterium TaxID=1443666 RepID=UPI0009E0A03A|nr:WYL domain-containing protein [Aquimarina megaterium]
MTKPLHHSQILEQQNDDGSIIISIKVKINFELERLLLGFGESIEVLQPKRLRKRISERLNKGSELYLD